MKVEDLIKFLQEEYKDDTIYYDEESGLIKNSEGKSFGVITIGSDADEEW